MISIDTSVLLGYYNSKAGILTTSTNSSASASATTPTPTASSQSKDPVPTAPWSNPSTSPNASALAKSALAGHAFIDVGAAQLDVKGASNDYQNLFALYSGLDAMQGLADMASQPNVSALQLTQIEKAWSAGMKQINDFVGGLKLDNVRLTTGSKLISDKTTVGVPATDSTYTTRTIYTGDPTQEVPAFQGDVKFDISIKQINATQDVPIDLSQMGTTPRTLNNVVDFINSQLAAKGVVTRFGISKQATTPQTIQVGTKTITLPDPPPSYSLVVKGDISEKVTFSADATAGAVYVGQTAGAPPSTSTSIQNGQVVTTTTDDQTQQLLKIQTDTSDTTDQPPAAVVPSGSTYNVDGKVFSDTLDPNVTKVQQTVTGSDGSVYVLANVDGTVNGQPIQGTSDVALLKYDSAGNLIYTRTLGASDSATGMAMSVSSDGRVAIAGSVTGALDPDNSGIDPTLSDSFVTVFDAQGNEQFTSRRGALQNDTATAVAFGDDGTVYVAGQTSSAMPGAGASVGGQDGYLEALKWNGKSGDASVVSPVFTTQFGSTASDKVSSIAVNGSSIVVGGTDGPDGVVRQFTLDSTGKATLSQTRDLGDLQGGGIVGVGYDSNGQVIVAGTTHNASLDAGTITNASSGGSEAFVARLDPSLAPSSSDVLSYFGGTGDDTATGMAIQGTDVWLTGQTTSDTLAGASAVGKKDGYVARVDPSTGQTEYVRRLTGVDGQVAPTSIAVDSSGSSALDRLGLPQGTLSYTDSQLLTASTSLRAGDQFQIRSSEGGPATTVTIDANDTLDTLAQKITRASNYNATVTTLTLNGQRQLSIKPTNDRNTIEVLSGPTGKDALGPLGLTAGLISDADSSSTDVKPTYALQLSPSMDLSTVAGAQAASSALTSSLSAIRNAYKALATKDDPPASATNPGKTGGTVPQYLTDQISNYQAALSRLTGGG